MDEPKYKEGDLVTFIDMDVEKRVHGEIIKVFPEPGADGIEYLVYVEGSKYNYRVAEIYLDSEPA